MNMHHKPSLFVQLAPTLVKNGWRPIPGYADTKRPSITRWNDLNNAQWPPDKLDETLEGQGQLEGEIVCLAIQREIVAVDLDILDEQQAQAAYDFALRFLGQTPLVRIGLAPKKVLIYRNDGTIKSRKLHPIEIFAGSGQVVGFGFHAKAGRDYQWPHKSPLELVVDDPSIPMISQSQLDQFLNACWDIIPRKYVERTDWEPPAFVGNSHADDRKQALGLVHQKANSLIMAPEGTRNSALFDAAYVAGQGIAAGLVERHEAELMLMQAASAAGLSPEESLATTRSGITKGGHNPFFVPGMWFEKPDHNETVVSAVVHAMSTDHKDVHFDDLKPFTFPPSLIKGLLPRNGIAFIGGQSGAGKTFVAVDLAVALTTGQTFFNRRVKERVGVMFVAGEGAETIQPRLTIARMARNVDGTLPIAWTATIPDFTKPDEVRAFISKLRWTNAQMMDQHGVRLGAIVIDTLAAVFTLQDENDNSEASKVIRAMKVIGDELDVLMVPIHHYGKGAETGLRGASAWRAGCDAVLSITAERNQLTGVVSGHSLWLAKSRVGEEGPAGAFSLRTMLLGVDEDGDELTSCYVVPELMVKQTVAARREAEAVALDLVDGGEWRADPQSELWVGRCVAEAFGLDVEDVKQKAQIKSILKRLIAEKKVVEVFRSDARRHKKKYVELVKKDNLSAEKGAPPSAPPCKNPCEDTVGGLFD